MKVGVIKIGSRISFNARDTSGGNGEARSIIKMLHLGGADVVIFTKILKKDNLLPEYEWRNLSDFNETFSLIHPLSDLDALLVLNGNLQFPGGAEDPEQITNYKIINQVECPVFYAYCDPELTLKQPGAIFTPSKAKWNHKYKKEELFITREDIIYLSQPHDVDKIFAKPSKNEPVPKKIIHFPFEKFPCLNERLSFNPDPKVDLSYGGTMRGGKRVEKMFKYYFNYPKDISVEMFGKIDEDDFADFLEPSHVSHRHPLYTGPVRYDEMLPKMNEAMCHIVIGDKYYEQINDMAQRAYESIWSSVVTFIDSDLDQLRRVYGADEDLSELLYVSSRQEAEERIRMLKDSPELREEIVARQFETINFDAKEYCSSFMKIIEDNI